MAVKSGRTQAGGRAAGSHTAALAASDVAVDALFRQAGVIRAETLEEMFDIARLLVHQPLPKGQRVAILTNARRAGHPLRRRPARRRASMLPGLVRRDPAKLREFLPPAAAVWPTPWT